MNIDIVIPNYNKKAYIKECLSSLLEQTYQYWRCIVVDGFSNDGSWETIKSITKNDARFEVYQIPKSKNLYHAWNFGLLKVDKPYFCILTSDDLWNKTWLEEALVSLNRYPNAVCAAARTKVITAEGEWKETALLNTLGEEFFSEDNSTLQVREGIASTLASYFLGNIYTSVHSLLIRSELLQDKSFAEDLGSTADYEWSMRLGLYGDIIYHPEIEVGWRVYEGQATKPRSQEENGKFIQKIHVRNRDEIAERLNGIADEFRAIAEDYDNRILTYHYARSYLVNLRHQPLVEIPRLAKILSLMPKELFLDCLFKMRRKSFFIEESLATANRVHHQVSSYK